MIVKCLLQDKGTKNIDIDRDNSTVGDLKNIISEKTGVPFKVIRLEGKRLSKKSNDEKLSQLNLTERDDVRVLYELEGGCGYGGDICGESCGCSCVIL